MMRDQPKTHPGLLGMRAYWQWMWILKEKWNGTAWSRGSARRANRGRRFWPAKSMRIMKQAGFFKAMEEKESIRKACFFSRWKLLKSFSLPSFQKRSTVNIWLHQVLVIMLERKEGKTQIGSIVAQADPEMQETLGSAESWIALSERAVCLRANGLSLLCPGQQLRATCGSWVLNMWPE